PRTRFHLIALAIALAYVLSAAFAEIKCVAIFGERGRYLGLDYIADMFVLYLSVAIAVRSLRDWMIVGTAILSATAVTFGYAILQRAGLDPVSWEVGGRARPFGTLGNADTFGHFLTIVL